jgi:hypothetical protein
MSESMTHNAGRDEFAQKGEGLEGVKFSFPSVMA